MTKFHLLPIGQQFEWEGKQYVKTKPLIARQLPDGGDKFIPRSALVTVATDKASTTPSPVESTLDSSAVATALARYHQFLQQLFGDAEQQKLEQLEAAYRELRDELKL